MARCFVLGNGPSLARTPLERLIGEASFAVTNIHLLYSSTPWRPTHYVRAEEASGLEPEHWRESMLAHLALDCEIWASDYFFRPQFNLPIKVKKKVHPLRACYHYALHYNDDRCPHLWHMPILCSFGSSVNVAVQLAALQGYNPIYLVGCDLGYSDDGASHFTPDYEHGREQPARYANLDTLAAHMIASRTKHVDIFNATLGGQLEVYERVEFDSLF